MTVTQWLKNLVYTRKRVTLVDAATIAVDATQGTIFQVTLAGNRTLGNPTGAIDGQAFTFVFIQDAIGSRTITLDTKFVLGSDIASVTLSTGANLRDFMACIYDAATDKFYVIAFVKGYA